VGWLDVSSCNSRLHIRFSDKHLADAMQPAASEKRIIIISLIAVL
jgi:hypothetical protein